MNDEPWIQRLSRPQPFDHLERLRRQRPRALAVAGATRSFTYEQLWSYSVRIAHVLRERGVSRDDVVVVDVANDLQPHFFWALTFLAAVSCTYPVVVSADQADEFDWLVTELDATSFPSERTIHVNNDFMVEVSTAQPPTSAEVFDSYDSVVRIDYSSGTTGRPVARPLSLRWIEYRAHIASTYLMTTHPYMTLMMFMSGPAFYVAYASLIDGGTYFVPGSPLENLSITGANFIGAVLGTPLQVDLLCQEFDRSPEVAQGIAEVQMVGSLVPDQLIDTLRNRWNIPVTIYYGSTESGPVTLRRNAEENGRDVGRALPTVDVEIVDEEECIIGDGRIGQVRVRRRFDTPAPYGSARTRKAPAASEWSYPGDLGRLDVRGHLILEGRTAELFNLNGVKVDPALIDAAVLSTPGVRDVATVPLFLQSGRSSYAIVFVAEESIRDADIVTAALPPALQVAPALVVRVDTIARTSRSKLNRTALGHELLVKFARRLE